MVDDTSKRAVPQRASQWDESKMICINVAEYLPYLQVVGFIELGLLAAGAVWVVWRIAKRRRKKAPANL